MLDPKLIRSNPEAVAEALKKRGFELDVDSLKALEEERRAGAYWEIEATDKR